MLDNEKERGQLVEKGGDVNAEMDPGYFIERQDKE